MAQTSITIDINTPQGVTVQQFANVLADYWGYTPQETLTKAQFLKKKVANYIRQQYIEARAVSDAKTARDAAIVAASELTAT